jgi:8-oxo-dGTP pyrophosphatase MutT (NUDIX family)
MSTLQTNEEPLVILGLDIDGVLHPEGCQPDEEWVHLGRFEDAMREVPTVKIVITSMWRHDHTLDELRSYFSADIAARIVGATPDLFRPGLHHTRGLRQRELEAWVAEHAPGAPWLGLEDSAHHYDEDCESVLLVRHADDGGIGLQNEDLIDLVGRLRAMVRDVVANMPDIQKRPEMQPKKRYVIIIPVDESAQRIVLLTKTKGPQNLIGKVTFPGGHVEHFDESLEHAAQRELAQKTGIEAPVEAFHLLELDTNDERDLATVFVSCDISRARTMESEAVFTADLNATVDIAKGFRAAQFAPDFLERVGVALPHIAELQSARSTKKAAVAVRHVIPCDLPNFSQSLDRTRPHKLLDVNPYGKPTKLPPNRRHQLVYEYTDTGDSVVVPNAPYNHTPEMLASAMRWEAQFREERVAQMRARTPDGWTPWMVENVAERVLANAQKLRALAAKVESGAVPFDHAWELQSEAAPSRGWAIEQEQRKAEERAQSSTDSVLRNTAPNTRRPRM